jgi:hypothetical protein
MKYDHSIDLQQDELDKKLDLEKERIENLKENSQYEIKLKGETVSKNYEQAVKALNAEKKENDRFYQDIANNEERWNKIREDISQGHLDAVNVQFAAFKNDLEQNAKTLGNVLQTNLIDKLNALSGQAGSIRSADAIMKDIQKMQDNADAWNNTKDQDMKEKLSKDNQDIGHRNGWVYDKGSGTWWKDYIGGTPLFHEGGIVGGQSKKSKMTDLVNKMFNTKPNEQVVKALQGELYAPESNILNNFLPNMRKIISNATPVMAGGGDIYNISVLIDKVMNNDKDANSIANKIVTAVQKRGGRMGRN